MRRRISFKRRSRRSARTRVARRKIRGGGGPSFHVMIVTAGRPALTKMIDSLKPQLSDKDALTIVFDGKFAKKRSTYTPSWIDDMKCKVTVKEQIPGLKHYGHHTINKYLPDLDPKTTYVMFADDDDVYAEGAFDALRGKCVDPDILYVARFKDQRGGIVPPASVTTIKRDMIGKVCGIIPFDKRSEASMGTKDHSGDFEYYDDLQKKVKGVQFLDDVIYLCDSSVPDAADGNIKLAENIGSKLKRVFLSKEEDYPFYSEYLESICNGDEIRQWSDSSTLEGKRYYMCIGRVPYEKIPSSCSIGFINTEQLSDPARLEEYNRTVNDTIDIFDYSEDNIRITGRGVYLPYKNNQKETEKLKSFMTVPKEYDVAIVLCRYQEHPCPKISQRRIDATNTLMASGVSVNMIEGWGDARDREIGKCRILINIHYSDTYNIYEAIRCERWRFAGMPIISETSASQMPAGIIESSYEDMAATVKRELSKMKSH